MENDIDQRCCGSGMCIIDPEGICWCGQKWDGEKMALPTVKDLIKPVSVVPQPEPQTPPESRQTRS